MTKNEIDNLYIFNLCLDPSFPPSAIYRIYHAAGIFKILAMRILQLTMRYTEDCRKKRSE